MNFEINKESLTAQLDLLDKLGADDCSKKNTDVTSMIQYYTGMTNAIEDRRNKVYQDSMTLLGILVSAAAFIIPATVSIASPPPIVPLLVKTLLSFISCQVLVHIVIVLVYYSQSKMKYAFNDESVAGYSNQWKWFYYGNKHVKKISIGSNSSSNIQYYIDGLVEFIKNYVNENAVSELKSNVIQLYLLQVHNYYKNKYYLELVTLQHYGFVISLVICVTTFIISLFK